jgi:hypothetical protein
MMILKAPELEPGRAVVASKFKEIVAVCPIASVGDVELPNTTLDDAGCVDGVLPI